MRQISFSDNPEFFLTALGANMRNQFIALLIAISSWDALARPASPRRHQMGRPPAVESSSAGNTESMPPPTKSNEYPPEPAEAPPDHGKELLKAAKVAAEAVVKAVVAVVYVATYLALNVTLATAH